MCLFVSKSHVKEPVFEEECVKVLQWDKELGGRWVTPFQLCDVPTDGAGWFMPKHPSRRQREFSNWFFNYAENGKVYGGFIHAYQTTEAEYIYPAILSCIPKNPEHGAEYAFSAVARHVVAYENELQLVCKALYIPAFDATGLHRNAELILD